MPARRMRVHVRQSARSPPTRQHSHRRFYLSPASPARKGSTDPTVGRGTGNWIQTARTCTWVWKNEGMMEAGRGEGGRKNQGRGTAEYDLVTRWGWCRPALPIAGTTSTAPGPSLLGPSLNALTRRASSTPAPGCLVLVPPRLSSPIPTPFVTPAPDPSLSLLAGTDNAFFLHL